MDILRTHFTALNQRASIAVTWQSKDVQYLRVFVKNQTNGKFVIINASKKELLEIADAIRKEFADEQ